MSLLAASYNGGELRDAVNGLRPTITGSSGLGDTLTCSNPGYLDPAFQWSRDAVAIAGATSATYVVTTDDAGAFLDCAVSGTGVLSNDPLSATFSIAQPANWAASWHEEPLRRLGDGSVLLVASDNTGAFKALRANDQTGAGRKLLTFTPLISSQDDHNAISSVLTTEGCLLVAMCGHAVNYQVGVTRNEIRVSRAPSGQPADLPLDRAAQIIIALPSAERPNYLQFYQIQTGAVAGRILLFYNDDTSSSWRCYFSDDEGATWTRGKMLFASSGVGQVYMRLDINGVFTGALPGSGYTSTFLPFYAFNHPSNATPVLRYAHICLITGRVYRPDTGAAAVSGTVTIFDQTSQDTEITTLGAGQNVLRDYRIPTTGRRQRIHMVRNGVVFATDFLPNPATNIRHIVRKAGVDYDLGAAGVPFWSPEGSAYNPDIQPGREVYDGDRVYRCYNDGAAYNSGAKLDRIDYPTGIQNGGAVTTNILTAGVTAGIAADEAIMRYFPVEGAGATGLVGFAWVGKYTSYTNWSGCRFVPVVI